MPFLKLTYRSQVLERDVDVNIYYPQQVARRRPLPHEIVESQEQIPDDKHHYQVLWLFHGGAGNYMEWPLNGMPEELAAEEQLFVVIPTVYDHMKAMQMGDSVKFVAEELPEYLSYLFPISRRREDNFIAGFSFGGYFTYRVALNYPDRYSAVGSFCSPIDVLEDIRLRGKYDVSKEKVENIIKTDRDVLYMMEKLSGEGVKLPDMFQAFGTADFTNDINRRAIEVMKKLPLNNRWEWIELEGGHSFETCRIALPKFLKWLNRKKSLIDVEEE